MLPVGANERGTPRIRSRAGWCCAVSEATAAPRPPVVVASSAVTIPAVWAAAARIGAGVERLDERDVQDPGPDALVPQQRRRRPGPARPSSPTAMMVTSSPSRSWMAWPGRKGEPRGVTSGTGNRAMRR